MGAAAPDRVHLGDGRGVWERDWDLGFFIDNGPVWSAAEWFTRIAWEAFLEIQV
jgi:hypothetical protein